MRRRSGNVVPPVDGDTVRHKKHVRAPRRNELAFIGVDLEHCRLGELRCCREVEPSAGSVENKHVAIRVDGNPSGFAKLNARRKTRPILYFRIPCNVAAAMASRQPLASNATISTRPATTRTARNLPIILTFSTIGYPLRRLQRDPNHSLSDQCGDQFGRGRQLSRSRYCFTKSQPTSAM
jgi:hypothetical protein